MENFTCAFVSVFDADAPNTMSSNNLTSKKNSQILLPQFNKTGCWWW